MTSLRNLGKRGALALLLAGAVLAGPVAASAATSSPPITHFPTKTPRAHPNQITHGPDGAVWFTELNTASVARMTASGASQEFPVPDPNQFVRAITDGPDGAVWFTEEGTCIENPDNPDDCIDFANGKIGRITTQGKITEFPVPSANGHPWEITHGPDGNLWFTELGDNIHGPDEHAHVIEGNKIGRITPQGQITEFPVPTFDSFPNGITTGPDGALWFTENRGNKIGRITTSGSITEFPIPTPAGAAIGIRAGLDGNLWFTEQIGQRIGRITPQGEVTEFPLPNRGNPVWITLGPDGAMWFTEVVGQRIGRITAAGQISEFPVPPRTFPIGITIGPGFHDVWFTGAVSSKVSRIAVCDAAQFRLDCANTIRVLRDPRHQPRP